MAVAVAQSGTAIEVTQSTDPAYQGPNRCVGSDCHISASRLTYLSRPQRSRVPTRHVATRCSRPRSARLPTASRINRVHNTGLSPPVFEHVVFAAVSLTQCAH